MKGSASNYIYKIFYKYN